MYEALVTHVFINWSHYLAAALAFITAKLYALSCDTLANSHAWYGPLTIEYFSSSILHSTSPNLKANLATRDGNFKYILLEYSKIKIKIYLK